MHRRMNQIVKLIRRDGSAQVRLSGTTITIGFADSGHEGELVMVGGGYYFVTTKDGRKFDIAKGQLIEVIEGDELDGLNFAQLMRLAQQLKVPGRGAARKPQLIEGIRAARAAA